MHLNCGANCSNKTKMRKRSRKKTKDSVMENVREGPSSAIQESTFSDKYYNTNNANRGVALIFNHYEFKNNEPEIRTGTNKDCGDIVHVLTTLNFVVRVYNDLTTTNILLVMDAVELEDHTNNDCIVIVVMTHGLGNMLSSYDDTYNVTDLYKKFSEDRCKSLKGKPKIFFIQACRGNKHDLGVHCTVARDGPNYHTSSSQMSYLFPQLTDLLVMYSSMGGYTSFRNSSMGSYFIQALCKELKENGHTDDLLSILTGVTRCVASEDIILEVTKTKQTKLNKQIPCIISTLTKSFRFPEK